MKKIILISLAFLMLISCNNEPKNKTTLSTPIVSKVKISKLDKFKNEGMVFVDTSFYIYGHYPEPEFTAKFQVGNIPVFLCEYYGKLKPSFSLIEFVLYNGNNEKIVLEPKRTAASYKLNKLLPHPEFTVSAWLPDSNYKFGQREYIKQELLSENDEIVFSNKLSYNPPKMLDKELDSLISIFVKKSFLNKEKRESVDFDDIADEMYIVKVFIASISGNKECERILYNLTEKFVIDGGIAESYYDYLYLDELLKNNGLQQHI